jgi:hypothetical protein
MGAIAEGFVAYAQPLIDQTDGSHEQMTRNSKNLNVPSSSP